MKKNFFKKLSFVLALAMVVSMITPAGAFASTKKALNSSKQYLLLGEDGKNAYDFNIKNKVKGSSYEWSSSNEDVATVDGSGVTTGVGIGTAKVTVKITKKGTKTVKLTADVIVKDNIATLDSIYMQTKDAPALDKLKVAASYDFGRTFTTKSGSTTKTTAITKWFVNSDKATIDKMGVFSATEPGKYTITAMAFQSGAKYTAWAALNDKTATTNVLATKTLDVTVVPSLVSTKQINATKFAVTFDSDMSKTDIATKAVVYKMINGQKVSTGAEKIKSLTFDTTGKIATVEMYADFTQKTDYKFVYGDLEGTFTAASATVDDIAGIVFDDFNADITVVAGTDLLAKVNAVDKNGVVIMSGAAIKEYLTFSQVDDTTKGYVAGSTLYMYKEGYAPVLTATFTAYRYDTTAKTYNKVTFSDAATATGVKPDTNYNKSSMQYAVTNTGSAPDKTSTSWSATSISMAAKDSGYAIYTRYKTNDMLATADALVTADNTKFIYVSTDTDKLVVNGTHLYPAAEGTVTVLVETADTNKTVVGSFDVSIKAARAFADPTVDTSVLTVGNNATLGETKTATITTLDTLATAFAVDSVAYSYTIKPSTTAVAPAFSYEIKSGTDLGKVAVTVDGKNATPGNYQLKVTLTGKGTTKDLYFAVIVLNSNAAQSGNVTVTSWNVELSSTSVDLKEVAATSDVTINVYGYNSDGVRVAQLATTGYTVSVKDATGKEVSTDNTAIHAVSDSGSVLTPMATGTYNVLVSVTNGAIAGRVNGSPVGAVAFTVKDSTTKSVAVDTQVVKYADASTILAVAQKAFSFTLNGTKLTDLQEANITNVTYSDGQNNNIKSTSAPVAAGHDYIISSVEYTVTNANGTKTVYTFDVNKTVQVQ